MYSVWYWLYHVPGEVGHPVDRRIHPADELQVFGFADALLDQEEDKTGRDEGHGEDHADGHHNIGGAGRPGDEDTNRNDHSVWNIAHLRLHNVMSSCRLGLDPKSAQKRLI